MIFAGACEPVIVKPRRPAHGRVAKRFCRISDEHPVYASRFRLGMSTVKTSEWFKDGIIPRGTDPVTTPHWLRTTNLELSTGRPKLSSPKSTQQGGDLLSASLSSLLASSATITTLDLEGNNNRGLADPAVANQHYGSLSAIL
jgi:hypothetical protein